MNAYIKFMVDSVPDKDADGLLVNEVGIAMANKLSKSRAKGRKGWHTSSCSEKSLLESLKKHVEKGDMVDVINLAAMIMVRAKIYKNTPPHEPQKGE